MGKLGKYFLYTFLLVLISGIFTNNKINSLVPNPDPKSGAVGLQGVVETPPPTQGATITIPTNGQVFTAVPVTVSGLCPNNLLVKIFKNNVFAGAVDCQNGSYSLQIDLFSGSNELVARVYDALDQTGPESNKPTVIFNDIRPGAGSRVFLSSIYAKRGTKPGDKLIWPIVLTGGRGPYAISVDWGDGSAPSLQSLQFAGNFDIEHEYEKAGIYRIIIKAIDTDGVTAFLQVVGVASGEPGQSDQAGSDKGTDSKKLKIIWQPAALAIPLLFTTFWLGAKYEYKILRKKIEQGDNPFAHS